MPSTKTFSPATAPLSTGRRVLFTAGMLLVPVLFFVLLEGVLRVVGYGDDYPLFQPIPEEPAYLYPNRDVARRYFARSAAVPSIPFDTFLEAKDSTTFRLFVQGGSSAAGYPFYYGGSFADILEQRLLQTFPGRRIEVVNTAMAAVNSYTLLDLVDEIVAQEPDAVLVYAGHNEYYGALGVGSSESLGAVRPLVNLYLRLHGLRVVQGLRDVLAWGAGLFSEREAGEVPGTTLMEAMVGRQQIPYGSAEHRLGLRQFEGNLGALLDRYREHGIPVFVGTLASNERDQKPFVSGLLPSTDEAAWRALYDRGQAAAARGDTVAALAAFAEAIALDSLGADAHFAKGRLLDAAGRHAEARAAYLAAKDRDQLPFRAPEAMNAIIRAEAARTGAHVVDVQAALAAASPGGIIGLNLMVEHLHPNVEGFLRIADAFYEALRAEATIGPWTRTVPLEQSRREILLTPADSVAAMLRVRQLMSRWPFQPPGVVDREMATFTPKTPVEEIAVALIRKELTWLEAVERQRTYFQSQGDVHRALQAALAVIQRYPFVSEGYLVAGDLLLRQGRYDEALVYFEAANDRRETAATQTMIGSILLQRGDRAAAIPRLERAVALDAQHQQALYNLAGAYALSGRLDDARRTARRLLDINPNHQDARRLLESVE